jgi:GNAT superfamily N-acetyltransferase
MSTDAIPPAARDSDDLFVVRPATQADIKTLARHRCEMFSDMGQLNGEHYEALADATARYLATAIPSGEYFAWVAAPRDHPDLVVAGGGVQLRRILPRPSRTGGLQPEGLQGLIVNVYTEKEWRRRGLAELIMNTILAWGREQGLLSIVLHASSMGRPLYERMGFKVSNEMYWVEDRRSTTDD